MAASDSEKRSVKSAERVFDLLEQIAGDRNGATFPELAKALGIPKSSLHALLEVLLARGYVDLDQHSRRYFLGLRAWETGQAYQRHSGMIGLATPVLQAIVARVNETAHLSRLAGTENVYLAKVDSSHALRLQSEVGARKPAHATGLGKALLAQLDDAEIDARFDSVQLTRLTGRTIVTLDALKVELHNSRTRGFAIDNEENDPGVFCLAVAVPGTGAALSVAVPVTRASRETLTTVLQALADGACQIAVRSGGQPDATLQRLANQAGAAAALETLVAGGLYPLPFA